MFIRVKGRSIPSDHMIHVLKKTYPNMFSKNILVNKVDKWSKPGAVCYQEGRDSCFALKFKRLKHSGQRVWLVFKNEKAFLCTDPNAIWWYITSDYPDHDSSYIKKVIIPLEEILHPEYKDKAIQKFVTHNMDFFV